MLNFFYLVYVLPCLVSLICLAIVVKDEKFWYRFRKYFYWASDLTYRTKVFAFVSFWPVFNWITAISIPLLLIHRWRHPDD